MVPPHKLAAWRSLWGADRRRSIQVPAQIGHTKHLGKKCGRFGVGMISEKITTTDMLLGAALLAALIAYLTEMGPLLFGLLTAAGFFGGLLITKPWRQY
jgi:hypothetical protein